MCCQCIQWCAGVLSAMHTAVCRCVVNNAYSSVQVCCQQCIQQCAGVLSTMHTAVCRYVVNNAYSIAQVCCQQCIQQCASVLSTMHTALCRCVATPLHWNDMWCTDVLPHHYTGMICGVQVCCRTTTLE